jgi:coenzyme F420 biosynthesis associated uncharacterized protein
MPTRTPAQRLRRTAVLTGVSLAGVVSARFLLKPQPAATDQRLLDWNSVRRHAHARSGESGRLLDDPRRAAEYDAIARDLAPLMAEVLGESMGTFPGFQALDRRGFIDANLGIIERLIEPLEAVRSQLPESRATAMSRAVLSRYMGEMLGFLSHRVLGQYDPVLQLSPPLVGGDVTTSLFLVEPNLVHFETTQKVPATPLRRWLILHELTHAWQFESHPWLKEYLASLMSEIMMTGVLTPQEKEGGAATLPGTREIVTKLPETLRSQLHGVSRIQAIMSVLEGYGNFVMHRVGREHLEHYDTLEKAFHARSRQRSLLERVVIAVTGMGMKMRQYETGERWAEAVTERAGLDVLNRVWDGPEMMPTLAELRRPEQWLRRAG